MIDMTDMTEVTDMIGMIEVIDTQEGIGHARDPGLRLTLKLKNLSQRSNIYI